MNKIINGVVFLLLLLALFFSINGMYDNLFISKIYLHLFNIIISSIAFIFLMSIINDFLTHYYFKFLLNTQNKKKNIRKLKKTNYINFSKIFLKFRNFHENFIKLIPWKTIALRWKSHLHYHLMLVFSQNQTSIHEEHFACGTFSYQQGSVNEKHVQKGQSHKK